MWGREGGVKKCGGGYEKVYGVSLGEVRGKIWGMCEKVRRDVGGVKKCGGMCGRVYGVSVEGVGKCVGVRCRKVCWGEV